ncbi:uncharacterized protein LOC127260510 [Andrographis paniculata]|uniref:uncharacterized protein LOC127260510 n=1 Tax=Andrographis paniculata TaxID=175694 RepID=UPI0021E71566|nr:uncharacterized protein LOC127260510 [Andrographis paniculata]
MEVAVIDWKSIDSRFVKDELYEHINAPKWVDFSAPERPVDDEAWFCRPGCNHPKTAEDFLNENVKTPNSSSKLKKSRTVSDVSPLGDRNKREAMLKKRGVANNRIVEDGENHDPNLSNSLNHKARGGKEGIKSSVERKEIRDDNMVGKDQTRKLRSTLSARNLFAGGDFLSKVADFCNELKRLAVRPKDGDTEIVEKQEIFGGPDEKERKPLLEVRSKEKCEGAVKGQRRKKVKEDDDDDEHSGPARFDED